MYHIIGFRKALIYICRCSLIFCFILSLTIGCGSGGCSDHRKELPKSGQQPLLGPQALLEKNNTTLHLLDNLELPIKKVNELKRVAKVKEDKQAIVLMHGLARLSSDFKAMIEVLKKKFPRATVIALESVNKDSSKAKSSSPSSKLPIRDQADLAYEEIQQKIGHGKGKHVVLVGHSQGGLRAFTLVKEYRDRLRREDEIVIDQLITIGTPWKGAPVFDYIKNVDKFNKTFNKIEPILDNIKQDYSKDVRRYFFKKAPNLAKNHSKIYQKAAPWIMKWTGAYGALDLDPESNFIRNYVASGLKTIDLPITAIAGVLTDFSKLFEPFPSSIGPQALAEVNATYATLIGGDPKCEHDMLLPVATQHAEGLVKKDFKCIKVYGACHGNKVGVSVKRGLSELNHKEVIQRVVESIEEAFYEEKEEVVIEKEAGAPPTA